MNRKIGAVLSYVYIIFEVLSTLLLTPFIIGTLGDIEYGVYKLIAALTSYLLLLDLGIGNSVVRYVAKYKENNDLEGGRKYIGVCMIFYAIISVVVLILGGVLSLCFQDVFAAGLSDSEIVLGKKLLILTVINVSVTLGTSIFNNIIIAYSKFSISKGLGILQIIVRMLLTAIALHLGFKSVAIVMINLVLTIAIRSFFAVYVLCGIKLTPKFKGVDIRLIKDIIAYSTFILLQMVATQINAQADQVLIGMLVASSAKIMGIYGIGTQIVQYFQSIGHALGGILMPGVVKLVESGATPKQLQNEMVRIGRYSFVILSMIFVGFFINGKAFLILWIGDGYEQSYYVALMLIFAYMFILTENIGTQILWAKNKHHLQSIIKFSVVILNVGLTIFLIKWDPLMGATIGTFVSLMIGDVMSMNIVFRKEIGISLKEYYLGLFKGILPCLVLSGTSGLVVSLLGLTGLFGFTVNMCVMMIIYAVSLWILGFNESEKQMVRSLFGKVKKEIYPNM